MLYASNYSLNVREGVNILYYRDVCLNPYYMFNP